MKALYLSLLVAFLMLGSVTSRPPAEDNASAERYIKESEAQWAQAAVTGDTALIERILADDFTGVEPNGDLYRKSEAVADVQKGKGEFLSNTLTSANVRFYGDVAVAQGSETWEVRSGQPRRGKYVWTDTWVKRSNTWQIVAAEDVTVPDTGRK